MTQHASSQFKKHPNGHQRDGLYRDAARFAHQRSSPHAHRVNAITASDGLIHTTAFRMAEDTFAIYLERGAVLRSDLEREGYTDADIALHFPAAYRECKARMVRQLSGPVDERPERINQAVRVLMELPAADLVPSRRTVQVVALQNRGYTKHELDDILTDVFAALEVRVLSLFQGAA